MELAHEPDFAIGRLKVSPSACRLFGDAKEIKVEAKTMGVLVLLARARGATVSREELVQACWDGRVVSDDAITRTIGKVRAACRELASEAVSLETLPKVGYRLIVHDAPISPAPDADVPGASRPAPDRPVGQGGSGHGRWRLGAAVAAGMIAASALLSTLMGSSTSETLDSNTRRGGVPTAQEVTEALWMADEARVRAYVKRGWEPNWKLDAEGNTALHILFAACERNPSHEKASVVRVAQFLIASGINPTTKNRWGDSPIDIASSPRYCGPSHPVVEFLRTMMPAGEPGIAR